MFLIFFFFFCSSNSMFFFFFFFFFFFVSAKDYRSSDLLRRLVMSLSRYLSSTPPLGVTLRVFNVPGAIVIREARLQRFRHITNTSRHHELFFYLISCRSESS